MVRRTPLLCAWVFLLTSAPCRGDRRQQDIVDLLSASVFEEHATGVASAVASSRHAANSTASQATRGVARHAANSSATRTASSSARSGANASGVVVADVTAKAWVRQGRSAHRRDQPSEHARSQSGDVLANNLTAATVQAHAALAHAVSALAEQQARQRHSDDPKKDEDPKKESESKDDPKKESESKDDPKKDDAKTAEGGSTNSPEEEKLQEEENTMLGGGLGNLATAMSDPRKFLMGLDSIKMFASGMRAAIEHGGEGKCLASGEFAGYGCGDDKDMPKICSCRHMFELCWLPDDPNRVVKKFPGQAALDEAKALLFGKCYTSYVLMAAVGVGGLVVLAVVAYVLKGMFKKRTPS